MKNLKYLFYFISIAFVIISCENESGTTGGITGKLTDSSDCKSWNKSASNEEETPDTLSCVEYSFDQANNKLTLTHINSGFNCCPEKLYVETSIENDTIFIEEFEEKALCDCNCLYDLVIELDGITADKYQIKFIEPYASNQQEIIFEADLANYSEGEYCVTRKQYPWGMIY